MTLKQISCFSTWKTTNRKNGKMSQRYQGSIEVSDNVSQSSFGQWYKYEFFLSQVHWNSTSVSRSVHLQINSYDFSLLWKKNNSLIHKIGCYSIAGPFSPHMSIKTKRGVFKRLMCQVKAIRGFATIFQENLLSGSPKAHFPWQDKSLEFQGRNRQNSAWK